MDRPLIEKYLRKQNISWRTDRTNADREITRNRIRLDIIPAMTRLNDRAKEHIAAAADELAEAERFLLGKTEEAEKACVRGNVLLVRPFLDEDPVIRDRVLRECIRMAHPGRSLKDIGKVHVDALRGLAEGPAGRSIDLPGGVKAVREEEQVRFLAGGEDPAADDRSCSLLIAPEPVPAESAESVALPFEGTIRTGAGGYPFLLSCGEAGEAAPPRKEFTKWLAYGTIAGNNRSSVCFRTRLPGDYMVVRSDGSRKKISDLMIDLKVPRQLRDRVVLLAEGSHILWIPGARISEAAKVYPGSRFLKAECPMSDEEGET